MNLLKLALIVIIQILVSRCYAQYELTRLIHAQDVPLNTLKASLNLDPAFFDLEHMSEKTVLDLYMNKSMTGIHERSSSSFSINPLSQIGSDLIYATGELLVDRAQQELYLSYISKLTQEMEKNRTTSMSFCTPSYSFKIKDLLPHSYKALESDNLKIPMLGEVLKKSFDKDLRNMALNLINIIPDCDDTKDAKTLSIILHSSLNGLLQGKNPASVLNELATRISVERWNKTELTTFGQWLQATNAIAQSMMNDDNNSNWCSYKDFYKLNSGNIQIYLKTIYNNNSTVLNAIGLDTVGGKNSSLYKVAEAIVGQLEWVDLRAKYLSDPSSTNSQSANSIINAYAQYSTAFLNVLTVSLNSQNSDAAYKADFKKITDLIKQSQEICYSTQTEDYANTVLTSFDLARQIIFLSGGAGSLDSTLESIHKYLTFAAEIASADSISQIKGILDQIILPVGSFKSKRLKHVQTLGINSYLGLGGAIEWFADNSIKSDGSFSLGIFAPIGMEYTWATKKNKSNGIFMSVVDLGAVSNFYFNTDSVSVSTESGEVSGSVKNLPELNIKDIFAPGLYYISGLDKDGPVTLCFGVQLAPRLREISLANGAERNGVSTIRINLSVAIDIPLFKINQFYKG